MAFRLSAHRKRDLERTGRRDSGQATRRSVTIGRCLRSASDVTASSSRTPGLCRPRGHDFVRSTPCTAYQETLT
jgi:hypothetical protein